MRFPDLEDVVATTFATLRRFPATLASALVGCGIAMVIVGYGSDQEPLVRALMSAVLGIALMFAIESASERADRGRLRLLATAVAAVGLLAFAGLSGGWSDNHLGERFVQLLLAFHLLASLAAFVGTTEENGFWQFNRALFMGFWTATLFVGVLFVGLAVALRSIEALFAVDIDGDTYARLAVFMAFAVHPFLFLAGIPKDLPALEEKRDYPPALKVFAQFILVPLVTVYLLILTAYLVRVVITQEWPSGWIGWLVSSVAAVGTLALLLVHPVRDDQGNGWVRGYARWFWIALMPSIVMLFLAIGKRISQYGFTERRYFLLLLAVWIAVVAVWFAITRSKRIRFIPTSLAVIALVSFVGPWGAYSVSRRSQVARLTTVLEDAGATAFPVPEGAGLEAEPEAARQVSDILRYLYGTHSIEDVRRVVAVPPEADTLDEGPWRRESYDLAQRTAEAIGMRYYDPWESIDNPFLNVFADSDVWPAPTEVYAYVFRTYVDTEGTQIWMAGEDSVKIIVDSPNTALDMVINNETALVLPMGPFFEDLVGDLSSGQRPFPPERLVLTGISDRLRVRLHIRAAGGQVEEGRFRLQNAEADVYLTVLESPP